MPQKLTYETGTSSEDASVFNQALKIFNTEPQFAHLAKDLAVSVKLKEMQPGVGGAYYPGKDKVEISTVTGSNSNKVGDYLNLLVHEFTHAAEDASNKSVAESVNRTNPLSVATSVGKNPLEISKALDKAGVYYGTGEPQAWLAANMTRGDTISRDMRVLNFIDKNPEFSAEFFKRNAQPNRPVGTHTKGEPEMTLAEKILNKVIGYQPEVKLDIPHWTKKDISRAKEQRPDYFTKDSK